MNVRPELAGRKLLLTLCEGAIEFVPNSFVEPPQFIKKQKDTTFLPDALLVTLQMV